MNQPSLLPSRAPKVTEVEVARFVNRLDGAGWVKAKALPWNERTLRALAAASGGRVISGQRGYHLTSQAPVEDVNHFLAWMRSQSDHMRTRAAETQQRLNGRLARSA